MATISTSLTSVDSLPLVGYSYDQLKNYIYRQLGSPVWTVEITTQQIIDAINDALSMYSQWRPRIIYGALKMSQGTNIYLADYLQDAVTGFGIQGIVKVDFVDSLPAPTEIFYGNLISPAPLLHTGLDEYDTFLRWRKTWQRVVSVTPDWLHDVDRKQLYIYNPLERYHAGVTIYKIHTDTRDLPHIGAEWVKRYSLEKARYTYGELLSKYSGAIPSPLRSLQLDQKKRDDALTAMQELERQLKAMQESTPAMID